MSARLNTIQFLTLRSIARGNWDFRLGMFEWRFNGKWSVLRRQHDRGLYDRAWDAAWELVGLGLVEMFTVRCCPGTPCHRNDRDEFRLTEGAPRCSKRPTLRVSNAMWLNTLRPKRLRFPSNF